MRYECEECGDVQKFGGEPDEEKLVCSRCGGLLRFRPTPARHPSPRAYSRLALRGHANDYPVLDFVIRVLWVVSLIIGVGAVVFAHILAFDGKWAPAITVGITGILTAILYIGSAEMMRVVMNIERGTRHSASLLEQILDRLPPGENDEP